MLAGMARTLVVKATAGTDAPERCAQAFTVAATAVAAGVSVSLWLTGESAWFALPGRAAEFAGLFAEFNSSVEAHLAIPRENA